MSGRVLAGTSGFSFKEWKGNFYPEGVTDKKMLEYYSTQLPTVEINYTFRRMPSEQALTNWKEQAAEGFQFTLKASQRITHIKRLRDVGEDVAEFVRRAKTLDSALGTVLFQLPPALKYDSALLQDFLQSLPGGVKFAMEFRNATWSSDEVLDALRTHGVALCGADTEDASVTEVPVTANHAYMRLRREEYVENDIAQWAERVSKAAAAGTEVFCYFKHEGGGVGPAYARRLLELATA